jgi:hypothetical protein
VDGGHAHRLRTRHVVGEVVDKDRFRRLPPSRASVRRKISGAGFITRSSAEPTIRSKASAIG